ncbi:hypothetical protein [Nostoc sp. UHCC 0251]|uniref:hypothetical protein n=1 Tax=Nostoc sp. UHCC 0251 TaxID=3110240 RepID=UPI002B215738|nr:hypothetical protein [Nostoc sp. UHCC 0251]MEA5628039.1 hypothetical protein [Nostoc sp. UHCC 0251]
MSFRSDRTFGAITVPVTDFLNLIKFTLENRRLHPPQSWEQQVLINLYKAKHKLEEVMDLLGE